MYLVHQNTGLWEHAGTFLLPFELVSEAYNSFLRYGNSVAKSLLLSKITNELFSYRLNSSAILDLSRL